MCGFAVTALGVNHREFWDMTPMEFNAASDYWIKMNVSQEDQDRVNGGAVNSDNPWNDADLVERAKLLMQEG